MIDDGGNDYDDVNREFGDSYSEHNNYIIKYPENDYNHGDNSREMIDDDLKY